MYGCPRPYLGPDLSLGSGCASQVASISGISHSGSRRFAEEILNAGLDRHAPRESGPPGVVGPYLEGAIKFLGSRAQVL